MTGPVVRAAGDRAVLADFGDGAAARVRGLDRALAARPFPGFVEAVPGEVSLMVVFDPLATDHAGAEAALRALLAVPAPPDPAPRLHEVAVRYDGPDLPALAEAAGLTVEGAIAAHLAGDYRVAMYGFAPGTAYLSGLLPALRQPRRPAARRRVPAGSVIVAGAQCIVLPLTMPTGWHVIGTSTLRVLTDDPARPVLFDPGDRVRFRRTRDP